MTFGGGGEEVGADGAAMAGAVEADRTIWVNADVAALWDRRERARRCLIAMFLSHSLSRVRQTGGEVEKTA